MNRALAGEYRFLRPRLPRPRPRTRQFLRRQHGYPHKEYFQNSDHSPTRLSESGQPPLRPPHRGRYTAVPRPAPNFTTRPRSSLLERIRSASTIGIISLLLGLGAGNGLVSWGYLQGPFESGSEEEIAMMDDITEIMNGSASLDALQNDPAWEEWQCPSRMVSGAGGRGLHFVAGSLDGSKGIVQVSFTTCSLSSPNTTTSVLPT